MTERKEDYSQGTDHQEEHAARLKRELREHIRFASNYDVLSANWLRMAASMHQVANVAFMEVTLPKSTDATVAVEGKTGGTLWDQDRDELAVRILLEEGKLNLALRVLHTYCKLKRTSEFQTMLKACCTEFKSRPNLVMKRCMLFEQSVGTLLLYAMRHVEALQIMDMPELMEHVSETLTHAIASEHKANGDTKRYARFQESYVIHYLGSVASHFDRADEDRCMELIRTNQIIPLLVRHLLAHSDWYGKSTLVVAMKFLSSCVHSEDFNTEPDAYLGEQKQNLMTLRASVLAPLLSDGALDRMDVIHLSALLERLDKEGAN